METHYISMDEEIQYMLLSMLSMKEKYGLSEQFISLSYTESDPKYDEKILNLKWGLAGDWKVFSFAKHFGNTEALEKFLVFLKPFIENKATPDKRHALASLWAMCDSYPKTLGVEGRNFDEGIRNLFKTLTSVDQVRVNSEDKPVDLSVPHIIINRTDPVHGHLRGYMYISEEKTFKNVEWPHETPNYIKPFLDAASSKVSEAP